MDVITAPAEADQATGLPPPHGNRPPSVSSTWLRACAPYLIAVLAVVVIAVVQLAFFEGVSLHSRFVLLYLAVIISSLYGGMRAGITATLLSALMALHYLIPPIGIWGLPERNDAAGLLIFLITGMLIAKFGELVQRAGARARDAELRARITAARQRDLEALRESEERYRMLAAATFEGIALTEDGIIIETNAQYAALFGYDPAELQGKPVTEIVHPDDRELVHGWMQTQDETSHEARGLCRDGRVLAIEVRGKRVSYHGRLMRITAVRDITERKQAEARREALLQEVRQQSELTAAILEHTDAQMAVLNREWTITAVNAAYEQGCGHARSTLIGRNHFDLFPNAENEAIFSGVRDTGMPYRAVEKPFIFTDQPERGTTYWNWIFTPIQLDGNTSDCYLLSLTDVTSQVRAREEMARLARVVERQAAEMEAAVAAIADGLIIYGADGSIVEMNDEARRLTGYAPEALLKPHAERLGDLRLARVDGTPLPIDAAPSWRALHHRETVIGETLLFQHGSKPRWVIVSAAPIRLAGDEMHGAVVTLTDTTALYLAQQELNLFVHMVSHDLRAPLTIMLGHASQLAEWLKEGGNPLVQRSMEQLQRGVRRMNTMIEDLVTVTRHEGEQLMLRCAPLDLSCWLPEFLDRSSAVLDPARIRLELPPALPLPADAARLERILTNLLTNALKYSPPDAPVWVRATAETDAVRLCVEDQGQGIAPDELPRLFDKFFRARNSRKAEGIGLGLYITRLLVEAHGGSITAHSTPGQGSTFTVTLPGCRD